MSINQKIIEETLITFIESTTGLISGKVIIADQDMPRPRLPYITLKILSLSIIGQDDRPPPDTNGNSNYKGDREFTASISYYGDYAIQNLNNIVNNLEDPLKLEELRTSKIVFVDILDLTDIALELETEIEPRANLDILFRTDSSRTVNVGLIEKTNITETYKDAAGNVKITDNYTIE